MTISEDPLTRNEVFLDLLRSLNGLEDDVRFIEGTEAVREAISGFTVVNGEFEADEDFFHVTLEPNTLYTVQQGRQTGTDSLDLDLVLSSYDGPFTTRRLDEVDDDSGGALRPALTSFETGPFRQTYLFQIDTYINAFVGVAGGNSAAPALAAGPTPASTPAIAPANAAQFDEPSNGDLADNINTMGELDIGSSARGVISARGDRDWFRVELEAQVEYHIEVRGDNSGSYSLVDPAMSLYERNGFNAGYNNTDLIGTDAGFMVRTAQNGPFYIEVRSQDGISSGNYRVLISEAATDIAGSPLTDRLIAPREEIDGTLEFGGDRDWFRASLVPGEYTASLAGNPDGPGFENENVTLKVYDEDGFLIAEQAEQNGIAQIAFIVPEGLTTGTYYIEAGGTADGRAGDYTIALAEGGIELEPTPENGGTDGEVFPFLPEVQTFAYDVANDTLFAGLNFSKPELNAAPLALAFSIPGYDPEVADFPPEAIFNLGGTSAEVLPFGSGDSTSALPASASATSAKDHFALRAESGAFPSSTASGVGVGVANANFGFNGREGIFAEPEGYTFEVVERNPLQPIAPGLDTVGDSFADALLLPQSVRTDGSLNRVGDLDTYAVFLEGGEQASFSLESLGDVSTLSLSIFASDGAFVGSAPAGSGALAVSAAETDFYFARVSDTGPGTAYATYRLIFQDPDGTAPASFGNVQPTARPDNAEVAVGDTIQFNLLDNDTDADDAALDVFQLFTTSTQGSVSRQGGQITYDPGDAFDFLAPGQSVVDTFRYAVSDGRDGAASAEVRITVTAPSVEPPPPSPGPGLSAAQAQRVALLYEAALDRDGNIDLPGLNFWIDVRERGVSEEEVAEAFLDSPEFENSFGNPDTLSDADLVDVLYRNVLERPADQAGEDFWVQVLSQPSFSRADMLIAFADSAENRLSSEYIEDLFEVSPGFWDFV